jgi:hypothetical protein
VSRSRRLIKIYPWLVLFSVGLWYVLTGQSQAEAATLGAGVSVLGQALLAIRLRGLRGTPPKRSAWQMAFNTSSRFAVVALAVIVLGPHLSIGTAAVFLIAYFVCQVLSWIGIAQPAKE